jgi:hypothetical protein
LFENADNGTFRPVNAGFDLTRAHRGSAFADFNVDGRIDVAVSSLGEPAELWQNTTAGENHWIVLKLRGTKSNRDGIGAEVRIGKQWNAMTSAVGYASSSLFGVHFGLGAVTTIPEIEIRWPSGAIQKLKNIAVDRVMEVREP